MNFQEELEQIEKDEEELQKRREKKRFMPIENLDREVKEFTKFDSEKLSFKRKKETTYDPDAES